jgi:hypothetical protein
VYGQELIVGLLVLTATTYLGWQTWRTWGSAKGGCAGGCSCAGKKSLTTKAGAGAAKLISVDELTERIRSR